MTLRAPSNPERCELRARKVHPKTRSRFGLNSKRAHPPIPPRGRALKLRPRELKARARFKFAVGVGHRYSRALFAQHPRGNSRAIGKTYLTCPVRFREEHVHAWMQ